MKAIDPNATRDYIPFCDREAPANEQTIFELRPLTPREDRLLDNTMTLRDGDLAPNLGDQHALALHLGLVGVRNFFDATGKDVKITREHTKIHGFVSPIRDSVLALIPKEVRLELAREIIDGAGEYLNEDERKN